MGALLDELGLDDDQVELPDVDVANVAVVVGGAVGADPADVELLEGVLGRTSRRTTLSQTLRMRQRRPRATARSRLLWKMMLWPFARSVA